jgi:glycosyltransferase involved in cell wall biosynthesis
MSSVSDFLSVNFCLLPDLAVNWKKKFATTVPTQLAKYKLESVVNEVGRDILQSLKLVIEENSTVWIALVSKQIKLFPKAFSRALVEFGPNSDTAVVYSDSVIANKHAPFTGERPNYSPELLRSHNYLGSMVLIKRDLLSELINEAPRTTPEAFILWMLLAASRKKAIFSHIPEPCYSEAFVEQATLNNVNEDTLEVLQEHLDLTGGGEIRGIPNSGVIQTSRKVAGSPLVSIVIPTKGVFSSLNGERTCFVLDAVKSIVDLSDYESYELVIVVDSGADKTVLNQLAELAGKRLKVVVWDKPFNFSQKMNYGVLHAEGDFVLLLNDDVKVISPQWLSSMLALAQLPNAGMVGAMLYYDDDSIQHAGHAFYLGSPTHIGLGLRRGSRGHNDAFLVEREVSGVTAACALMPKSVFLEVGGFSALLPGNFNDVDLCLKTRWKGYDIYWTPFAELYHFESKTRDARVHYYELDVIEGRWGLRLNDQRYWRGHPWRAK